MDDSRRAPWAGSFNEWPLKETMPLRVGSASQHLSLQKAIADSVREMLLDPANPLAGKLLAALGKTDADVRAYVDHPAAQEAGLIVWDFIENEIRGMRTALEEIEVATNEYKHERYGFLSAVRRILNKLKGKVT